MCSFYVWDSIWKKDSYSENSLRQIKAKKKYEFISKAFKEEKYERILDLGCGAGFVSNEIIKNNSNCNIIAIDKSTIAIQNAKKMFNDSKLKFLVGDICNIPIENNSVDIVLCIGSIEHIKDDESVFTEVNRVIKKNGKVIITSSNKKSFMYVHRKLKEKLGVWKYGYQKNWDKNKLIQSLEKHNIKLERISIENGIGDFKYITMLDGIVRIFNKSWGRYIVYEGRKI